MSSKLYYTLLIYVRTGQEPVFQAYENKVLPLLPKYQGKLELRLKTTTLSPDQPYEVHIVSFPSANSFEAYRQDPERLSYAHLFKAAVEKTILIPGRSIPT